MKKALFFCAIFISSSVFASTDHYILKEGNHTHHLKVKKLNEEYTVEMDVDFEPNPDEKGGKPCDAEVSGEAKSIGENKIQLKKHSEGEATFCTLDITLSPTGAKVEQSKDCDNFVTGLCHFTSEGKELLKIK